MPVTVEAALVVIFAVAPGFLCARVVRSEMPSTFGSRKHDVVLAVLYSVLIHILLLPYTINVVPSYQSLANKLTGAASTTLADDIAPLLLWVIVALFVAPIVVATFLSWVWRRESMQRVLSFFGLSVVQLTPTAWDWFFLSRDKGCWLIAEMEDGKLIGGEYGKRSFSSLSPHRRDIFIEKAYAIGKDYSFESPFNDNIGMWINGDNIRQLYVFRVEEGRNGEQIA